VFRLFAAIAIIFALPSSGALASAPSRLGAPVSTSLEGWPLWPALPEMLAQQVLDRRFTARERESALHRLGALHGPYAESIRNQTLERILHDADDSADQPVVLEAFRLCLENKIPACRVRALLSAQPKSSLASAALDLLAVLDPGQALRVAQSHWQQNSILLRLHALKVAGALSVANMPDGIVEQLFADALAQPNPDLRRSALESLENPEKGTNSVHVSIALIASHHLNDVDPGVRLSAAMALGRLDQSATLPALIRCVRVQSDAELARTCLESLVEISDPAAERALLDLARSQISEIDREVVTMILARRRNPSATFIRTIASPILGSCSELGPCFQAATLLAEIGDAARPILEEVARLSPLHHLLASAPLALARLDLDSSESQTYRSENSSERSADEAHLAAWRHLAARNPPEMQRGHLRKILAQTDRFPDFAASFACPQVAAWSTDQRFDDEFRKLAQLVAIQCVAQNLLPAEELAGDDADTRPLIAWAQAKRNASYRSQLARDRNTEMRRAAFYAGLLADDGDDESLLWAILNGEPSAKLRATWQRLLALKRSDRPKFVLVPLPSGEPNRCLEFSAQSAICNLN
jgi:hypothetical protein